MYTGSVNTDVQPPILFWFMTDKLATAIFNSGNTVNKVYKDIDTLEKIASFADISEYVNINYDLNRIDRKLKCFNVIDDNSLNSFYMNYISNFEKYISSDDPVYSNVLINKDNDIYKDDYINDTDTKEQTSYELARGINGTDIIVIFKPNFTESLKVRNEFNDFILACLGELRNALSNKQNLTKYKLFSKIFQL